MGLEDFNTSSSGSTSTKDSSGSEPESEQKALDGTRVSKFMDEWGKSRSQLLRDTDWLKNRLEEGWDFEDFTDELRCPPNTAMSLFQRGIEEGAIDYDDIPDFDGDIYQKRHLKWYVEMAVKHRQFPYVPSDRTHIVSKDKSKYPTEYLEVVDGLDTEDEEEETSKTGLDAFTT